MDSMSEEIRHVLGDAEAAEAEYTLFPRLVCALAVMVSLPASMYLHQCVCVLRHNSP